MSGRIITADEAASLLGAATRGPWRVWSDEGPIVLPTGQRAGGWTCSICRGEPISDSDHACVGYSVAKDEAQADADGRLLAAAPDLAATVIAQATEIERLRAIVNGRTTPPTEAEVKAHGGAWLVWDEYGQKPLVRDRSGATRTAEHSREVGWPSRWWPLDGDYRPCAWPVVAEASR